MFTWMCGKSSHRRATIKENISLIHASFVPSDGVANTPGIALNSSEMQRRWRKWLRCMAAVNVVPYNHHYCHYPACVALGRRLRRCARMEILWITFTHASRAYSNGLTNNSIFVCNRIWLKWCFVGRKSFVTECIVRQENVKVFQPSFPRFFVCLSYGWCTKIKKQKKYAIQPHS